MATQNTSHLELACNHVLERWFPVNQTVLDKIRTDLSKDIYGTDVDALIAELRGDFALLFYCVKELSGSETSKEHQPVSNPIQLLRQAGVTGLKKILEKNSSFSTHSFKNITQTQAKRIQEAMLSATVAESVCGKADVNPELGFSCALLRQLGLTLIAWNYPHVFIRGLTSLQNSKQHSLDVALHKVLGFSPTMLGAAIAQRWNLGSEIRLAAGDPTIAANANISAVERGSAETLAKICKVGEALARAGDPERYPSALSDWKEAEVGIQRYLGPSGLKQIEDRLKDNLKNYVELNPNLFNLSITPENETKIKSSAFSRDLIRANHYVQKCPPLLQAQLTELYQSLVPGQISREHLDRLVHEVFPCAGFDTGCVFMLDPYSMILTPMLKIKDPLLPHLHSVKVTGNDPSTNPIVTAFNCGTPIKGEDVSERGAMVPFIAGTIGVKQKSGVLYVEITDRLRAKAQADPLLHFKAIRQCLNDCLGLA